MNILKDKNKKVLNGSKKIIKISIVSIFLVFLFSFNIVMAGELYECLPSCQVTDPNNGPWYRQASQDKCIGIDAEGNSVVGCEENIDYTNQCCEHIDKMKYKETYGNYDMKDLLTKAINISHQLLGIVGSIALLMFIIAGVKMILAGGTAITDSNKDKITTARKMLVQTIIGLLIFLSAYLIVSFVQKTLLDSSEDSERYQLETEEPDYKSS